MDGCIELLRINIQEYTLIPGRLIFPEYLGINIQEYTLIPGRLIFPEYLGTLSI